MSRISKLTGYGLIRFPDPVCHLLLMVLSLTLPLTSLGPAPSMVEAAAAWFLPEALTGVLVVFLTFGGRSSGHSPSQREPALLPEGGDIIGPTWFLEESLVTPVESQRHGYTC